MKVVITGGTHGVGKGVAKVLAALPGEKNEIIVLCRSEKLGRELVDEITTRTSNTGTSLILCDLADLSTVQRAVVEIHQKHEYLDGVFINAGIGYASRRNETVDSLDSHFQVNYLAQFFLLNQLLGLLEKSTRGGRVIFNTTGGGKIFWDDIQMTKSWNFEQAIHQSMVAKRMMLVDLHNQYRDKDKKVSFIGFEISKTVWTNQINLIPLGLKIPATIMKALGGFISIEKCGEIMAPLFTESAESSLKKSGRFLTWKKGQFIEIPEDNEVLDEDKRKKLWEYSFEKIYNILPRVPTPSTGSQTRRSVV